MKAHEARFWRRVGCSLASDLKGAGGGGFANTGISQVLALALVWIGVRFRCCGKARKTYYYTQK